MKKSIVSFAVVTVVAVVCWACSTPETIPTENLNTVDSGSKIAVGNEIYALVLAGTQGTPIPAGMTSLLHTVDVCTGNTTSSELINDFSGINITGVTGIAKMNGVIGYLWGTTGQNSNFPFRILKISAATAVMASPGPTTTLNGQKIPLQDLENRPGTADYYAIIEGTSRIVKVNVGTGACTYYASAPSCNGILNGLTFQGTGPNAIMWVISGKCNTVCTPKFGDMWAYIGIATGTLITTRSYKAIPSNLTNPELGLIHTTTCGKGWVVGSASYILSNNANILLGCATSAVQYNQVKPTYDFAPK